MAPQRRTPPLPSPPSPWSHLLALGDALRLSGNQGGELVHAGLQGRHLHIPGVQARLARNHAPLAGIGPCLAGIGPCLAGCHALLAGSRSCIGCRQHGSHALQQARLQHLGGRGGGGGWVGGWLAGLDRRLRNDEVAGLTANKPCWQSGRRPTSGRRVAAGWGGCLTSISAWPWATASAPASCCCGADDPGPCCASDAAAPSGSSAAAASAADAVRGPAGAASCSSTWREWRQHM